MRIMAQAARDALFIRHASPEDNAFTLWLGTKLTALGYSVFADILRLRGGDDWERVLEGCDPQQGRQAVARRHASRSCITRKA
jgi:hypothetical protein